MVGYDVMKLRFGERGGIESLSFFVCRFVAVVNQKAHLSIGIGVF
jgi:hypothetical protein